MLHLVRDVIPSGVAAYEEFSDATHAGVRPTWMAHTVHQEEDGTSLSWSSRPRFRPEQVPLAAGQLRQLVEGCDFTFAELAEQFHTS